MVDPLKTQERVLQQFTHDEQYILRPLKSIVQGFEVVIKLHRNKRGADKNPFISWTLNKVAVVDQYWLKQNRDNMPIGDMDWWRVKIEKETSPGYPVGCFVVRPLWKVNREDLAILAPSTWTQVQTGPTILLYPKIKPWMPWIVPKALRKLIMRKTGGSALCIPLSYPPEGEPLEYKQRDDFVPFYAKDDIDDDTNHFEDYMVEVYDKIKLE